MFSQTTEYALRAMASLASAPNDLVPTTILAAKTNVPANYLAKVLQQLASSGLIRGRRGVGGGYTLAKDASDITLLQVVRTVGEFPAREGLDRSVRDPDASLTNLHKTLGNVRGMVMDSLEGVTLQSLVDEKVVALRS